jgi:hypothetical protein
MRDTKDVKELLVNKNPTKDERDMVLSLDSPPKLTGRELSGADKAK